MNMYEVDKTTKFETRNLLFCSPVRPPSTLVSSSSPL